MINNTPDHVFRISSELLRHLLEISRQQLTPGFYEKFCREAGFEQYAKELPPMGRQPVNVTRDQISTYMAKIFSVTHEGVYPLFTQNTGLVWFKGWADTPAPLREKAEILTVFHDPQLALPEKLQHFVRLQNKVPRVTNQTFRAEGDSLLLDCPDCVYCRFIKTDRMVCFLVKTWYANAIRWLTEKVITAEQIQSTARGDGACVHRFTFLV